MPTPDQVYREFIRRTNRTMATYLSLAAWTGNLECVVLQRDDLTAFWGISQRVESQRIGWLTEDVRPCFPVVMVTSYTQGSRKFAGVYLARTEFPEGAFSHSHTHEQRAKILSGRGFRTQIVQLPKEEEMLRQLTAMIHGLGSPLVAEIADRSEPPPIDVDLLEAFLPSPDSADDEGADNPGQRR